MNRKKAKLLLVIGFFVLGILAVIASVTENTIAKIAERSILKIPPKCFYLPFGIYVKIFYIILLYINILILSTLFVFL